MRVADIAELVGQPEPGGVDDVAKSAEPSELRP